MKLGGEYQASVADAHSPLSGVAKQKSLHRVLLLLTLVFTFALYLHELTYQDIWWDEARNIDVALRPITQIATAPELDIHPPLYFWLLHLWGQVTRIQIGENPHIIAYIARFLSVAVGLCAVALLYPLGRRLHSPTASLGATFIAATSPFWLAESQETRMYTLSFALLSAAAWFLLRVVPEKGSSKAGRVPNRKSLTIRRFQLIIDYCFFILLSTAALYTHYNAIFILITWYAWWGVIALSSPGRWRHLRAPLFCGISTILLLLPIVPTALRQIPTYANPNLTIPTVSDYLWQNWQAYLGGYALAGIELWGYTEQWLWAVVIFVIVGALLSLNGNRKNGKEETENEKRKTVLYTLLPTWLFGGLALYYIAVLDRGAFNVRYSSFVTPPLYLLLGMALANWARLWRPLVVIGLVLYLVGVVPAIRSDLYAARFAREDIGDLTTWLRQETGPNDLILVDQKYPFGFYYHRYAIDAAQTPAGPETALARYLFVDVNTLDGVLTTWAGDVERVFWVQWFESDTDPRHAVRFLLDIYGERAGERTFQGYDVDWWTFTPPTTFALPSTWVDRTIRFINAVETTELAFPAKVVVGEKLPVAIRWRRVPDGVIERPLKARVALYDEADNRVAQADERLLNDRHRLPAEWGMGEQPLNLYLLTLPGGLAEGTYEVRLLVYDADTLEPLSWLDEARNPAGIEEVLGAVEIGASAGEN